MNNAHTPTEAETIAALITAAAQNDNNRLKEIHKLQAERDNLKAEHVGLKANCLGLSAELEKAEALNAELVEALKEADKAMDRYADRDGFEPEDEKAWDAIRAALAHSEKGE